jgi:hypothetical protein
LTKWWLTNWTILHIEGRDQRPSLLLGRSIFLLSCPQGKLMNCLKISRSLKRSKKDRSSMNQEVRMRQTFHTNKLIFTITVHRTVEGFDRWSQISSLCLLKIWKGSMTLTDFPQLPWMRKS